MNIDMSKIEDLKKTNAYKNIFSPDPKKEMEKCAQKALIILIRYAMNCKPITYGQLAKEVENPKAWQAMGVVGGLIGNLTNEMNKTILKNNTAPMLNALIINANTKIPSVGVNQYLDGEYQKIKIKQDQKKYFDSFYYPMIVKYDWNGVLRALEINEVIADKLSCPILAMDEEMINGSNGGTHEEGPDHKKLKKYIYDHPHKVKIKGKFSVKTKKMEQILPSADRLDIYFESDNEIVAVEIKPKGADKSDVNRGVFQCIKYRSVIEANNLAIRSQKPVRVLLVLGGEMPVREKKLCEMFRIAYFENINYDC